MSRQRILWLPLVAFILLAAFLVYGLARPGTPVVAGGDLATGTPHLVNIFASWCVPCAAEAPSLKAIADAGVPVVGIAIRDRPEAVADFLGRHGNPFSRIGVDGTSDVQMALGSSGVPETFVVDGRGVIRQQTIGPIDPRDVPAVIAAVKALG